jgi:hypothetical protein
MKDFIINNPEIISKILEVEGFNKEKLENILEITSNPKVNFKFAGSCPHGLYLQVDLENRIDNLSLFIDFLKEKELYNKDYHITKRSYGDYTFSVTINEGKPSEVNIEFENPF